MEKRIGILGVKFAPTKTGKDKWIIEITTGTLVLGMGRLVRS